MEMVKPRIEANEHEKIEAMQSGTAASTFAFGRL
jgi:hypothetical protein